MQTYRIENFVGGWFAGQFKPNIFPTKDFELAVKYYKAGDKDKKHYHKIAKEITCVIYGKVRINGQVFVAGDIIEINPLEVSAFDVIEDACNVVLKVPGELNDKYEVE